MTSCQFVLSALMRVANSGAVKIGSNLMLVRCSVTPGMIMILAISPCSRSTTSLGFRRREYAVERLPAQMLVAPRVDSVHEFFSEPMSSRLRLFLLQGEAAFFVRHEVVPAKCWHHPNDCSGTPL